MKLKTILIILLFGITNSFAQQQDSEIIATLKNNNFKQRQEIEILKKDFKDFKNANWKHEKAIDKLTVENKILKNKIDSLNRIAVVNRDNIKTNSKELGTKIQETENKTSSRLSKLDSSISNSQMYWGIGTLATLLLGGLMYFFLGKRINSSKSDVEAQIRNTKQSLEEESIKLDSKLVEVLDTQLKIQKAESVTPSQNGSEELDHSLALKVADEIIRIQKNLGRMDDKTKGLKQLNASVKRIQDNFASNGYELVDMLGKEYNEGMKVTANFIPSDDIESGKEIITRIIKPQVNFKNEMIQSAQIEVSIGE